MKPTSADIASVIFLWPFSILYFLIYQMRRMGYRAGLFKTHKSRLPVICVGNLTAGGTGKSPFCIMLAGELQALGFKPAILSRGYKRMGDSLDHTGIGTGKKMSKPGRAVVVRLLTGFIPQR